MRGSVQKAGSPAYYGGSNSAMIEVKNLTKLYGNKRAVNNISFAIDSGEVVGFLGPNGAGKSTTMNIICGYLSSTSGTVTIDGVDILDDPLAAKRHIGYLPEIPPLYVDMTVNEYLEFAYELKGVKGTTKKKHIGEICETIGITHVRDRVIRNLSKGYKQRVGIAQALLGNPRVIILDEPTVGLDPLQIIEIRDLIKSLGETHTVIFSSHILSEVQTICDEILMISGGKLVAFDTPENLEKQLLSSNEIILTTDAPEENVMGILGAISDITEMKSERTQEDYLMIHLKTDLPDIYELSRKVFASFAMNQVPILEMRLKKATLEDVFIELAEGQGNTQPAGETLEAEEVKTNEPKKEEAPLETKEEDELKEGDQA